jgi:alginate O-acetyltransferase complex protein AlgI
MLFNSFVFAAFLAIVLPLYYLLSMRGQNVLLFFAGLIFYGWWDWRFLGLLLFSTALDWAMGLKIDSQAPGSRERKRWLIVSVIANLGILGFFKYFNFFIDSAAAFIELLGMQAHMPTLRIVLPVGISFYTFQSMSYTIDVYRGDIKPQRSLFLYSIFVSYFPQLVAGPIERASALLPAFEKQRKVNAAQISEGLQLILFGFFKKLAIADAVASSVNAAFSEPRQLDGAQLLRAMYLFMLQIYGDFSGYSDIARGVSKLFGIDLMVNFNQPYFATSITEHWRRWHISLSTWLRDYLYIPLGGSRNGRWMTYRNNFLTMLLGGLWHGASWNYVIWGGLHGVYLAVHKFWMESKGLKEPPTAKRFSDLPLAFAKALATFHLVLIGFVFFRSPDLATAKLIFVKLFTDWNGFSPSLFALPLLYFGLLALIDVPQYIGRRHTVAESWPAAPRAVYYGTLLLLTFLLGGAGSASFIYFQF